MEAWRDLITENVGTVEVTAWDQEAVSQGGTSQCCACPRTCSTWEWGGVGVGGVEQGLLLSGVKVFV